MPTTSAALPIGFVPTSESALQNFLAAMGLTEHTYKGEAGGCTHCGEPMLAHVRLNEKGQPTFRGCINGTDDMVFLIVGVSRSQAKHAIRTAVRRNEERGHSAHLAKPQVKAKANELATVEEAKQQQRHYHRARYRTNLHHKAKVENLDLPERQEQVMSIIHAAGKRGVTEAEAFLEAKRLGLAKDKREFHGWWSSTKDILLNTKRHIIAMEDAAAGK